MSQNKENTCTQLSPRASVPQSLLTKLAPWSLGPQQLSLGS